MALSLDFGIQVPFVQHLGFTLEHWADGRSELRFIPQPMHCNSFEAVHGGVLMTLLDVSMAVAARSIESGVGAVTIEMKTSFMRSARLLEGGALVGRGQLLHATGRLAFVEGVILDDRGERCAQASGTFRLVRPGHSVLPTD